MYCSESTFALHAVMNICQVVLGEDVTFTKPEWDQALACQNALLH